MPIAEKTITVCNSDTEVAEAIQNKINFIVFQFQEADETRADCCSVWVKDYVDTQKIKQNPGWELVEPRDGYHCFQIAESEIEVNAKLQELYDYELQDDSDRRNSAISRMLYHG